MPVSVVGSGTLTATTTSSTLASSTVSGAYELHVDLSALTSSHTVQYRINESVLSTGTSRSVAYASTTGEAGSGVVEPTIKVLGPVGLDLGGSFAFIVTAGTSGIAIPWKVLRI